MDKESIRKSLNGTMIFSTTRKVNIVSLQSNNQKLILGCEQIFIPEEIKFFDRHKFVTLEFKNVAFVRLPMEFYIDTILELDIKSFEEVLKSKNEKTHLLDFLKDSKNIIYFLRAKDETYGWVVAKKWTFHIVQQSKRQQRKSLRKAMGK